MAKTSSTAALAITTEAMPAEVSTAKAQLLTAFNSTELSPAPLQLIPLPSPYNALPLIPQQGISPVFPNVVVPKIVREYPMPGARETHEMAVVGDNMLVISQQTNSTLVKVQLSPSTGRPLACARFLICDFWAGLHGITASRFHEGDVWATLQFKSLLIRIKVGEDLATAPKVMQIISLPPYVNGPHCVYEFGEYLWTGCKDSNHVVCVNHTKPTDCVAYACSARPIFIAMHPTSSDIYASLDLSSKIWRLIHASGETTEIDIPPAKGNTPVGLVQGPDGNVWFTLVGGASGGTGTFARIFATGEFQWFSLTIPVGIKAGLLHLAFDFDYCLQQQKSEDGSSSSYVRLWLLGSTLVADEGNSIDAVFTVIIDTEHGRITNQHSIALPTQICWTHRVLPHRTGLFVTQLKVSSLAHVSGNAVVKPADVTSETTDFYNDFGLGQSLSYYMFSEEGVSRGALLGATIQPASTATPQLKASSSRGGKRPRTSTAAST